MSNSNYKKKNRLVISLGDPAGIGTEVILKALGSLDLHRNMQPLLVGCKQTIEIIYSKLKAQGIQSLADPDSLEIENIPCEGNIHIGKSNAASGEASFQWLTRATELVMEGEGKALVTAPIAKYAWSQAGYKYPGQTERLGELTNVAKPSMLFTAISPHTGWRLNTLLATTHIPLEAVAKQLSPEIITAKLNALLNFCQKFKQKPKLLIAGLNPHAGENGQLGHEEIKWIIPTIEIWRKKHPNITLDGPMPPDTCWISAAKSWQGKPDPNAPDGILALYHDQGLIPIKLIAFESAVNTTLGLPFIRTSPDHGTGFDIAGKGLACCQSMQAALEVAWELSNY